MKQQEVQDNSLTTLRNALFKSIFDVRNGDMNANDAQAIAKLSHQAIETYKTEIKAVEVADNLKDKNVRYAPALKAIANKENLLDEK